MQMESYTKMFITIYKIMWCHIVNSNETHTQRVLPSPKKDPDNNTHHPTPPKERVMEKNIHQILCRKKEESFTVCKPKFATYPILYFHVSWFQNMYKL